MVDGRVAAHVLAFRAAGPVALQERGRIVRPWRRVKVGGARRARPSQVGNDPQHGRGRRCMGTGWSMRRASACASAPMRPTTGPTSLISWTLVAACRPPNWRRRVKSGRRRWGRPGRAADRPRSESRRQEREALASEIVALVDAAIFDGRCDALMVVVSSRFLGVLRRAFGERTRWQIHASGGRDWRTPPDAALTVWGARRHLIPAHRARRRHPTRPRLPTVPSSAGSRVTPRP